MNEAGMQEAVEADAEAEAEAEAVFAEVKALRLAGERREAARRLTALAARRMDDPRTVTACYELLHRCAAWEEALELLGRARSLGVARTTRGVRIVEADCLRALVRPREARAVVEDIDPATVRGFYRTILDRVLALDVTPPPADVQAIEQAFRDGEPHVAVAAFHALLDRCRSVAAPPSPHAARDREARDFAAAFVEADEDGALPVLRIISDSIAMPRAATGVALENCYPWLLGRALAGVARLRVDSRRQRTVRELPALARAAPDGDCFLLQVGVVDCAPRVFSERDIDVIRSVCGEAATGAMMLMARRHREHLQGDRKTSTYVPLDAFEALLAESVAAVRERGATPVLMTIVTPSRSGGKMAGTPLARNIADYNAAIARVAAAQGSALFDADAHVWSHPDAPLCFSADNYHYNALGHERCARGLAAMLAPLMARE